MQQTKKINCKLCSEQFNSNNRLPILICQQKHHICLQCLQHLTPPFKCPFCQASITKQKVRLDQLMLQNLGGTSENPLQFRYLYYKDQLRIVSTLHHSLLENSRRGSIETLNYEAYQISKKILKIQILIFVTFTILSLMIHLFLVFTEQQQCIDWSENSNTYTIRQYLKLTILVNLGCFTVAALLHMSENQFLKGLVETYGGKLTGAYIIIRISSETIMWSYFMFVMQPQCNSFIFLYLHIQTFGYYIFALLFTISFSYYCIRKQRMVAQQ